MGVRFCSQCGARPVSGAKFCAECGAQLAAPPAAASAGARQITLAGSAVLLVFLAAGLAIWTTILAPAGSRPAPAGPRGAPASARGPSAEGRPARVELPAEVKSFIADLAARAKDTPRDVDTWMKLAQVYARAAQLDRGYQDEAVGAFEHVLGLEPSNADALRGLANIHYDRDDHRKAIPVYEKYLALRPDDLSARTDLATMYLYAGDPDRAIATYEEVIRRNPSFLQAHYNLAVTYHGQGKDEAALKELEIARGLAPEEAARKQIDDMIASLRGEAKSPPSADGSRSPFQGAVEASLRAHPIMGPRIVRFEWSGPARGRVLVQSFPMEGMPPEVRDKFTTRLAGELRGAQAEHPVEGPVRIEIADVASGRVMAAITP
jgi:cytochrome c-type biogenesis protein CcmH/NrfG